MRGPVRLGFRQLNVERWVAAPLYTLSIESREWASMLGNEGAILNVTLGIRTSRNSKERTENFYIKSITTSNGRSCSRDRDVKLHLNTMADTGLGETQYWLDSGCVKR